MRDEPHDSCEHMKEAAAKEISTVCFEIFILITFTSQAYPSNWRIIGCGLAGHNFYLPEPMGTVAWCIWNISSDKVALTWRGFFMLFRGPWWVGYKHVLLFLPAQSVVSFFLCFGHIVIEILSFSVATNCPARFKIRPISLMFSHSADCCRPELTPRFSRWGVMSNVQVSRGTIWDPVPSKLQAESEELNNKSTHSFRLKQLTDWIKWHNDNMILAVGNGSQ